VSSFPDNSLTDDSIIIGTAGHIDHGKTRLVHRLTGIDTDRLPEEKSRGISIDLGFAWFEAGSYRFAVVDVPGHERFVRNMVAGATGIDLGLLVVAADDGVMRACAERFCRMRPSFPSRQQPASGSTRSARLWSPQPAASVGLPVPICSACRLIACSLRPDTGQS
jgi:hypothetical protein